MKLKILLFGPLISKFGRSDIKVYIDGTTCEVRELKRIFLNRFPTIRGLNFKVVVNHEICNDDHTVKEGDEVAFLPPISGGAYSYLTNRKITESLVKQLAKYEDLSCGSTWFL
jgi:molybdopterin synthase catalytic subunit